MYQNLNNNKCDLSEKEQIHFTFINTNNILPKIHKFRSFSKETNESNSEKSGSKIDFHKQPPEVFYEKRCS